MLILSIICLEMNFVYKNDERCEFYCDEIFLCRKIVLILYRNALITSVLTILLTTKNNIKMEQQLSKQARNSLALYRGQNASSIKQLLRIQRQSVKSELMAYCNAKDEDDLAIRLSLNLC